MHKNRIIPSMQHNKLFYKIFVFFLTLLVPIIIIGYITYSDVKRLIYEDTAVKLTENLKASSQTIEQYLNMARLASNDLLFGEPIQSSLVPYDLHTDSETLRIRSIIKEIASNRITMDPIIDSLFLYIDDKKVYADDGLYDFNQFFTFFNNYDNYPVSYWAQHLHKDRMFEMLPPAWLSNMSSSSSRINVIPSLITQYINGYLTTVVANISISALEHVLLNNSIFDSTRYVIFDSQHNVIFRSAALSVADTERLKTAFQADKADSSRKPLELSVGADRSMVVNSPFNSFGWSYYSVTPLSEFNQQPASILDLIWWSCISLFVIGIVFSMIFSFRLYNPIRNIRDILLQNSKTQEVSREIRLHGELYMIGNRIHRLFEENEDVTRRMNKYSGELLDKFFFDLINGQTAGRTTYDILDKIGFKQGEYLCCCLMISYNEQFYHEFTEEDGLLIQSKLKNVLQGILSEHVNGYLMELDHHLYVYVVNLSGEEERVNLRRALDNVLTTFEYDMVFCSVTIGVGKPYSQITDMDKSVNDALTAIDIQMANETTTILDASELDIKQTYYFSFLDEIKMINGLKAGDMDEVRSNVERIIHFNRKNGISWHYLGHLLVMLFNSGYRYFIERNTRATPVISEEQYAVLTDKNILPIDYKDRIQLLYAFFEAVISETVTKPEQKSSLMMKRITSYIEENYDKDLHLELISSEMGMSSKYISSFFKEMTGTNITEYVSLVRITAAKQLLLQTDLKITEIAERVGIFSRTTFLRNFKKHEGISPLEYVKANSSKLDGTVPQD